jgi:hypothetical protein
MPEMQNEPNAQGELTARFVELILMQTQNILFLLGKIPTPDGRVPQPNFEMSRLMIDQLECLQYKTQGNLSPEEEEVLSNALTQTRMAFVETLNHGGEDVPSRKEVPAAQQAPEPAKSVEAPPASSHDDDADGGKRFVKKYG